MNLVNKTAFPAEFLTGSTGASEMVCIVCLKATYVLKDGALVPVDKEEAWPVFKAPMVVEGVAFPAELDYRKRDIDIVVLGKAIAPPGVRTVRMEVAVETGKIRYPVAVFGDRRWVRSKTGLVPSDPEPFTEMPLTASRAFGGKAVMDGIPLPHIKNAEGKGYYFSEQEAVGKPLPNLERAGELIKGWSDQPRAAVLAGPSVPLGMEAKYVWDENGVPIGITHRLFNFAVNELVATREQIGKAIRLSGCHPQGVLTFPVPPLEGPRIRAEVGGRRAAVPLTLSSLVLLPQAPALVAGYLGLFRYLMRPREKRHMELSWPGEGRVPPVST